MNYFSKENNYTKIFIAVFICCSQSIMGILKVTSTSQKQVERFEVLIVKRA